MIKPRDGACEYKELEELAWDYMFISSCLTKEQDERLKKEWEAHGGYKTISWWRFVMENTKIEIDIKNG